MGLRLIADTGYDPGAMPAVWQLIGELDASAEMRRRYRRPQSLLATHPAPESRMRDLNLSSAEVKVAGRDYDRGRDRWRAAISPHRQLLLDDQVKLNDPGASLYIIRNLAADGWDGMLRYYEGGLAAARGRRPRAGPCELRFGGRPSRCAGRSLARAWLCADRRRTSRGGPCGPDPLSPARAPGRRRGDGALLAAAIGGEGWSDASVTAWSASASLAAAAARARLRFGLRLLRPDRAGIRAGGAGDDGDADDPLEPRPPDFLRHPARGELDPQRAAARQSDLHRRPRERQGDRPPAPPGRAPGAALPRRHVAARDRLDDRDLLPRARSARGSR